MMYGEGDRERQVSESNLEPVSFRPEFRRDYGRIIHSASFRRQQGKTQVFPGAESDFFRTRLTHSLEVSQIAEGIADYVNDTLDADQQIDSRLCATAGLVHDIGHPPFGHNGERALDQAMLGSGGFEGNAQTLRILTRLEKKEVYPDHDDQTDKRAGLNLCLRTLGAILKYDRAIPLDRFPAATEGDVDREETKDSIKVVKGYYSSEESIVKRIKDKILRGELVAAGDFKTVECQIMDIADDIAYSVYDLEDCLKVRLITPAQMLSTSPKDLEIVAEAVRESGISCTASDVFDVFSYIFNEISDYGRKNPSENIVSSPEMETVTGLFDFAESVRASSLLCDDGYKRTELSSKLVKEFIRSTKIKYNNSCPAMSKVFIDDEQIRRRVEVLKKYTYIKIISSSWVKIGEYRGYTLVKQIFEALDSKKGYLLMPDDVRILHQSSTSDAEKKRVICDFVAGMTDRYALEFWGRLYSDVGPSMFKPV